MFVIPVLAAAVLLLIGMGIGFILLTQVYLPQLGISLQELHQTGEQIEQMLSDSAVILCVYAGAVVAALLLTIAWTDLYLTRNLFRHISEPLDALTAGVDRIRDGDLDTPIAYTEPDEFKAACDAVDEMAARLKASLEQQQLQQQKKQELIAGMSHDLKSPMTSIRAYTEALLDGVAKDETARLRYLRTIYAKEEDMEALVNRLFEFSKMDASAYPVRLEPMLLRQAVEPLTREWKDAGMEICLEIPETLAVNADKELLRRIISNLLSNAQKYGGRETVHVNISAKQLDSVAEVSFADDGPGVPPEQRLIFKNGMQLSLKNKEYELLLFLMRHPGQVFSREDLYEMIWGLESMGDNATVAVHVNRLREKMEDEPSHPRLLQTVWGVGYRLSKGEASPASSC